MQVFNESLLIKSYIAGDESALEELIYKYKNRIYSFIYNKISDRDIAEDIFQETFIKVIKTMKRGSYKEQGKFLPWVLRISHNLIIDYYRKGNKLQAVELGNDIDIFSFIADGELSAENEMIKEQIFSDLRKMIQKLPDDQKEVLIMRMYKDMSFKEIAEETNVSINTALGRMRYALLNLRKLIDKHRIILQA
ncbi:MAG: RNA polymerase subunit sigma-24 [Flavobacteriia bacterium]|nr:MAG: RNA polymerase subunit sigma-24 [Flavobacteriia bacterium]